MGKFLHTSPEDHGFKTWRYSLLYRLFYAQLQTSDCWNCDQANQITSSAKSKGSILEIESIKVIKRIGDQLIVPSKSKVQISAGLFSSEPWHRFRLGIMIPPGVKTHPLGRLVNLSVQRHFSDGMRSSLLWKGLFRDELLFFHIKNSQIRLSGCLLPGEFWICLIGRRPRHGEIISPHNWMRWIGWRRSGYFHSDFCLSTLVSDKWQTINEWAT